MALLVLDGISKAFQGQRVLDEVDLFLEQGSTLCLLGPSGCGKTTLLRIVAGLERPDAGRVIFRGRDITSMEAHRRRFGMMFQDFALFPHKDVLGNVSYGLRMQNLPRREVISRAMEALSLVNLADLAGRSVLELSGGERQRVALARTLAIRPPLVLLDEPLGSLDRAMRERLMVEIRDILREIRATCIFVTHDQGEACAMADMTAVMFAGRIVQVDPPRRLYRRPATPSVARFLGLSNLLEGVVTPLGIDTPLGHVPSDVAVHGMGSRLTVLVQPDAARMIEEGCASASGEGGCLIVRGAVRSVLYRGRYCTIEFEVPGGARLTFDIPDSGADVSPGREVTLAIDPRGVAVLGR
jgi:ABC-type Fe3+/spermidine/putrescine transport system ATPase subunit